MIQYSSLIIPFFLFFFPSYTTAYTWQLTSPPSQCQNVSIAIQGSGQPPYSLLLLPHGPNPLPEYPEDREIQNFRFTGNGSSLSFFLDYPENSSFVAVVSDSSGFGTGGTSIPVTVLESNDSTCYDPTLAALQDWFFYADPGGITQCEPVRCWWELQDVNGTVNFYGVIPGGDSFTIPQGPLSTISGLGTGFNWTVDIRAETDFLVVGNDDSRVGAGGVAAFTVGFTTIDSCLNSTSPSSTVGSPAGGSYPTGNFSNSRSGGRSYVGLCTS
ncbi:hypothetical protein EI94DRAFT_64833 [Lactarius quietus]|nr:hypothetical protein EI94DRAFT_64833 [Lactarius quietus]